MPNLSLIRVLKDGALCLVFGSLSLAASVNAQATEIAAVGPVERVNCFKKSVRVLGIEFDGAKTNSFESICDVGVPTDLIYVAVAGESAEAGVFELTKLSVVSIGDYVPGASPVYVRGIVTAVNPQTGEFTVSGAQASSSASIPQLGTSVEVLGIQPLPGGSVLVSLISQYFGNQSQIRNLQVASSSGSGRSKSGRLGSTGTDKLSSSGSGMLSSSGSGTLSSSGSGMLSSSGSGTLSSSGSGTLSSSGSGKLSSSGSGTLSSSGSGKLSSSGSGMLSSSGSGTLSSSGSGTLSSSGSGKLSSSGSGMLSSSGSGILSSSGSGMLSSSGSGMLSSSGSGF